MEKIDKLIIKACKTENTDDHLRRIYNTYWLAAGNHKEVMIHRMADILTKLNLYEINTLIFDIQEKVGFEKFACHFERREYTENISDVLYNCLINKIRFMEVDKLKGYKNG